MTRMRNLTLALLALCVLLGAGGFIGCGGGGTEKEERKAWTDDSGGKTSKKKDKRKKRKGKSRKRSGKRSADDEFEAVRPKYWDTLSPHFETFVGNLENIVATNPADYVEDVFASKWDWLEGQKRKKDPTKVPKEELVQKKQEKKKAVARKTVIKPKFANKKQPGPAQKTTVRVMRNSSDVDISTLPINRRYSYKLYSVRLILTGMPNPVAKVEAPTGEMIDIHLDDTLGIEGVKVVDILTGEIVLNVPGTKEREIISITPGNLDSLVKAATSQM